MRILLALSAAIFLALPLTARAQNNPVVLELYTSQGCSSCPPADALFGELSEQPGIIALALHVDYWDYLGWKDSFGRPENTRRQRAYAKVAHERSVFTPQMIIQGQDRLIGHRAKKIAGRIKAHQARKAPIRLDISRRGDDLHIRVSPLAQDIGAADVQLVRFIPSHEVAIDAGENAGQRFEYTNIVTDWSTVARWDGRSNSEIVLEDIGSDPIAIIVQRARLGAVLSAAKLP